MCRTKFRIPLGSMEEEWIMEEFLGAPFYLQCFGFWETKGKPKWNIGTHWDLSDLDGRYVYTAIRFIALYNCMHAGATFKI